MPTTEREIRVCADSTALAQQTAVEFIRLAKECIASQERFTVALAGGSTPKAAYTLLASADYRKDIRWEYIHFFWGDERHVPPNHTESNYRMAYETLLSRVPVPLTHMHRIRAEQEAQQAADEYEKTLRTFFDLTPGAFPRFDLILLGMGPDGHTASLFPGTSAVHETRRLVVAPWVEKFQSFRITLTPPVLGNAAQVIVAVGGTEKAKTLQHVLQGPYQPDVYPVQIVKPTHGKLLWLVDNAAAQLLV
jgi:6-phosphogluconolactonase